MEERERQLKRMLEKTVQALETLGGIAWRLGEKEAADEVFDLAKDIEAILRGRSWRDGRSN